MVIFSERNKILFKSSQKTFPQQIEQQINFQKETSMLGIQFRFSRPGCSPSIHLQTIWLTTLSIVFPGPHFDIDLKTIHQIVVTRRSHSNFQHLCPVNSFGERTSGSGSELIHLLTKTVWSEKWNV